MAIEHWIQVSAGIDPDAETMAGRVRDQSGEVPFMGWLALVAALEDARRRTQGGRGAAAAEQAERDPGGSNSRG